MEQPLRSGLNDSEVYLAFDSQSVILWVGSQVDKRYI